jgi:hypothetical protein
VKPTPLLVSLFVLGCAAKQEARSDGLAGRRIVEDGFHLEKVKDGLTPSRCR